MARHNAPMRRNVDRRVRIKFSAGRDDNRLRDRWLWRSNLTHRLGRYLLDNPRCRDPAWRCGSSSSDRRWQRCDGWRGDGRRCGGGGFNRDLLYLRWHGRRRSNCCRRRLRGQGWLKPANGFARPRHARHPRHIPINPGANKHTALAVYILLTFVRTWRKLCWLLFLNLRCGDAGAHHTNCRCNHNLFDFFHLVPPHFYLSENAPACPMCLG